MTALNLGIQESENPEIWDPTHINIQILKIKIRDAQNVGKVWIRRKKQLPAPFGAISGKFFHGPETCQKLIIFFHHGDFLNLLSVN